MAVLWEGWVQSRGNWHSSQLLLTLQSTRKNRRRGGRRWMTEAQLAERYGQDVAQEIIEHKSTDAVLRRTQVKNHPDCPRLRLFLCFDYECEEEEEEDVLGHMASASYKHGGDHDQPGRRSRKRKHESDSDSESPEEERRMEREALKEERQKEREMERKRQSIVKDAKKAIDLLNVKIQEAVKRETKIAGAKMTSASRETLQKEILAQKNKLQTSRDTMQADEINKLVTDAKKKMSDFGKFMRDMTCQ
ncbi:unnamed protein product [Symbiodinium microadriaticum]|nr:unnamed protein product [Symbiodinium microadriaticum]